MYWAEKCGLPSWFLCLETRGSNTPGTHDHGHAGHRCKVAGLRLLGCCLGLGTDLPSAASRVTSRKLFNFPLFQFPHLENGEKRSILGCCVNSLRKNTELLLWHSKHYKYAIVICYFSYCYGMKIKVQAEVYLWSLNFCLWHEDLVALDEVCLYFNFCFTHWHRIFRHLPTKVFQS